MSDLPRALIIDASDNVATAMTEIQAGSEVAVESGHEQNMVVVTEAIDFAHKFAIADIEKGQEVRKYGASIGIATADIASGMHVHVHNIKGQRGGGDSA
ncbi:MAG: UxaA family hydrolase [Rhodospirillaceae bacterium]|jgi:altronate dehydratase small subunit|nr:UxaA family hydrolase [Rhodospirillaceae bacterium]